MRILSIIYIFLAFIFIGCNKSNVRGVKYGGTLKINASRVPDIIFPGQVLKLSEQLITNQIYVGLVKYNTRTLDIIPSLAKKWRVERDKSLYTFYINNNAYFHNDDCFGKDKTRKITANDVKYSIEQIAKFHVLKQHEISFQLSNIKGSENILNLQVNNDTAHISGIKVINDTTIVFELIKSDPIFIHYLASTNGLIFAKEAFDTYGFRSTVGSGAFTFKYPDIKGHTITLVANPNFFLQNKQKQQLPFIDTILVSFITSSPKELALFEQGKLDMITGVTGNYVIDFLDNNIDKFQNDPPYYIMKQVINSNDDIRYNFLRANVRNLHLNSINYFDFSEVFFKEPVAQEIIMK
jgi:ABC-type transport system substrate-binding protein